MNVKMFNIITTTDPESSVRTLWSLSTLFGATYRPCYLEFMAQRPRGCADQPVNWFSSGSCQAAQGKVFPSLLRNTHFTRGFPP